jgi:hypothetical protein
MRLPRRSLVSLVQAVALAAAACTPTGSAKAGAPDAGSDAKGALDAGGSAQVAAAPDASTDEMLLPPSSSEELTTRARHLLDAVRHDDPGLALDIVFPRDAYLLVKDAADPGKQWDTKVITLFQRQVHALHRRTRGIDRAQFVTFEIGEPVVQAVPKKHDLRRSLWRVRHSRLTYTIDGKAMHIDFSEMLSWRGSWYVTKLRGKT